MSKGLTNWVGNFVKSPGHFPLGAEPVVMEAVMEEMEAEVMVAVKL